MVKFNIAKKSLLFITLQIVLFLLISCSGDKVIPGERVAIIKELSEQNIKSPGKEVAIPPSEFVKKWSQFRAVPSRLSGNLNLARKDDDFNRSRIIRVRSRGPVRSPIIVSDVLYYMDYRGNVHASGVDGSDLWSASIPESNVRITDSFPGGLAFSEGTVYFTSHSGKLAALDSRDGKPLWEYSFDQPFRSYPLVYRKNVYIVTGDDLGLMVSPAGKILWSFIGESQANSVSYSASPSAFNGRIFFPFSSGSLHAVDFANGSTFWKKSFSSASISEGSSFITDFGSSPVVSKFGILVSSFAGQTMLINFDGNIIWKSDVGTSTAPVIIGENAFLIDKNGYLIRLSLSNGRVVWSRKLEKKNKGIKYFDPILVNGNILITKNDRILTTYSPFDGTLIVSKRLKGEVAASPISYMGEVYIPLSNGRIQIF